MIDPPGVAMNALTAVAHSELGTNSPHGWMPDSSIPVRLLAMSLLLAKSLGLARE
ncbi:MAG: hypothetical protein ACRDUV_16365 [Pseudonocardiaceae bacterium]